MVWLAGVELDFTDGCLKIKSSVKENIYRYVHSRLNTQKHNDYHGWLVPCLLKVELLDAADS